MVTRASGLNLIRFLILFVPFLVSLFGCGALGPEALKSSRTDYNVALRQTEDEQLLLNIVRLRYRDRMFFLEPSSVNTQFTFAASVEPSLSWFSNASRSESLRNRIAVEERPTITYRPLRGKEFVERILAPIPLETLILLGNSGWPIDRVLRTTVEQINGVENDYRSFHGVDNPQKDYRKFVEITEWLRRLELEQLITGAKNAETGKPVLILSEEAERHQAWLALRSQFGFSSEMTAMPLLTSVNDPKDNALHIVPRSFDKIMFFLSQAVDVPENDLSDGFVPVRNDASGVLFDEKRVAEGLFRVFSSNEEPESAAVKVFYRDNWFYISDKDFASKSTFSMLNQIFALQSGSQNGAAPILTIPIGG